MAIINISEDILTIQVNDDLGSEFRFVGPFVFMRELYLYPRTWSLRALNTSPILFIREDDFFCSIAGTSINFTLTREQFNNLENSYSRQARIIMENGD